MSWFEGFTSHRVDVGHGLHLFARTGGNASRPPLVLLHGFPETHALWHRVATALANDFFLVLPDLRGYGASSKPPGEPDHANYSKRAMAADVVALMRALGHERFGLAGHDRGARVAHRLALDHPQAVERLALIDIAPTYDMYATADQRFGRAYYHWFHLIQPSPLPEKMIAGDAPFYLRSKLGGWGSGGTIAHVEPEALAEYERAFCNPEAIHAACEDYRAGAGIDLEHDAASRAAGVEVACPTLVIWGARGVIASLYDPLTLWQAQCAQPVQGLALPAGHFIPEEAPRETADALRAWFAAAGA